MHRVWLRRSLIGIAILVLLVGGLLWFAGTEPALQWAVRQATTRMADTVEIQGAKGSLYGPLSVERTQLNLDGQRVTISGLDLDWSPSSLFGRKIDVARLHADRVEIVETAKKAPEPPKEAGPPQSLDVPVQYDIDSATVGEVTYQGDVVASDVRLSASYDGQTHHVQLENIDTPWGSGQAQAQVGAQRPFPVDATAEFKGEIQNRSIAFNAALDGSLERLQIAANANTPAGSANLEAVAAPFAPQPLRSAQLDAEGINPSAWDKTLPQARLQIDASASTSDAGQLTGSVQITNANPAPIDQEGIPLQSASTALSGDAQTLQFNDLRLDFARGGALSGSGRLQDDTLRLDLQAKALNLQALTTQLQPTQLNGPLQIVAGPQTQQISAQLRDEQFQVAVEAVHRDQRIVVEQLRLSSGKASLAGEAALALQEPRAFSAQLQLSQFDPARFGDFPQARINADIDAEGKLVPTPQARVELAIRDSVFRDAPLSGGGTIVVEGEHLGPSQLALRLGPNRIEAKGRLGGAKDTLRFDIDAPKLAVLGPEFGGALRASGTVQGAFKTPSIDATARATKLALPGDARIGQLALDVDASVNTEQPTATQAQFELNGSGLQLGTQRLAGFRADGRLERGIEGRARFNATFDDYRSSNINLDQAQVSVNGTREQHAIQISARNEEIDLKTTLTGRLDESKWRGRLMTLVSGGQYPAQLQAPAPLVVGAEVLQIKDARFSVGDGSATIENLDRNGARIRTRGSIERFPTRYVDAFLPKMQTTLALSGNWNLTYDKQISGALQLQRDSGDVVVTTASDPLKLGLQRLDVAAEIAGQRLEGKLDIAGNDFGTLAGTFALPTQLLQADSEAQRRAALRRPMSIDLQANLPRLQALNALLPEGTQLAGAATLDLDGSGSIESPSVRADLQTRGLRVRSAGREQQFAQAQVQLQADAKSRGARSALQARLQMDAQTAKGQSLIDLDATLATEYAFASGVPTLPESGPLSGKLTASVGALDQLVAMFAPELNVRGDVRLEAAASGTLARPEIQANLNGKNLNAVLVDGRLPINDGNVQLQVTSTLDRRRGSGSVNATLAASASPLGQVQGSLQTELARRKGQWGLPGSAPLVVDVEGRMQSLAWAGPVIGPGALVEGTMTVDVEGKGTVAEPGLRGTIEGRQLKVYDAETGLELEQGQIDVALKGDTVVLETLRFEGGEGTLTGDGQLELGSREGRIELRAEQLRLLNRPDRLLVLSGAANIKGAREALAVVGEFKTDRAIVTAPDVGAPELGPDVVVVGREEEEEGIDTAPTPVALDIGIDLGDRFFVKAAGLDAQLTGKLRIVADAGEEPRAVGRVEVAKGAFSAYGQKLTLQRAQLNFNGPIDNPQLDIRAVRTGLEVEAGVEVKGTAQNPRAELFSDPDLPQTEQISWLVLGHGLQRTNAKEFSAMQAAAGFLLGKGESASLQARLAEATGLDEVGISAGSDPDFSGATLSLGKRLTDDLFVTYERGLGSAANLVKLTYDISKRWKVQAQSGEENALDLLYTLAFD